MLGGTQRHELASSSPQHSSNVSTHEHYCWVGALTPISSAPTTLKTSKSTLGHTLPHLLLIPSPYHQAAPLFPHPKPKEEWQFYAQGGQRHNHRWFFSPLWSAGCPVSQASVSHLCSWHTESALDTEQMTGSRDSSKSRTPCHRSESLPFDSPQFP